MDNLGQIFDPIFEFLKDGFHHVNVWWGLLIGLFATVLMRSWNQLFLIAGGAALTYIVIREATPIVMNGAELKLPDVVDIAFWQNALSFFVGFIIIIAMFFAVKSVAFRRGGGKKAKASH
jgi:hypothetical protein